MKPSKPTKMFHVPKTKIGMGDNYGTGVKNKVGKLREDTVGFNAVSPKGLKKPPKSLA